MAEKNNSKTDSLDLSSVNKSSKSKKTNKTLTQNLFKKQSGPNRDEEGKFAAQVTTGAGGLKRLRNFNLKRAIPLLIVVTIVGGSLVYQSFAAACSIRADKTSLYEGESTTIRWNSPVVPVVIDGGNMGSVQNGQWNSGTLYATKTFQLVGGWDSSCTGSVTVTVSKKPAAAPATPPASPPTGGGPTATAANIATVKKWYNSCVKDGKQAVGNQSAWEGWAKEIVSKGQASAWTNFKTTFERGNPGYVCSTGDPAGATAAGGTTSDNPLKDAQAWVTLGAAHVANAKSANAETYKISTKIAIERGELTTIANKEVYVRGALGDMRRGKGLAQGLYNTATSSAATKSQGPAIQQAIVDIQRHIEDLAAYATNIANDYKRAETTYEANLSFFGGILARQRKQEDCRRRGGSFNQITNECKVPEVKSGGYGGGPAPGSSGSTIKVPVPSWLTAYQDQLAYAKGFCEKEPNKRKTVTIQGGYRVESYDVYYKKGSIECGEKFSHIISVNCGDGWRKSGNECINAYANAIESHRKQTYASLPDIPHRPCPPKGTLLARTRCVRVMYTVSESFADGYNKYIESYVHCERTGTFFSVHDGECKTEYGKWKFPKSWGWN